MSKQAICYCGEHIELVDPESDVWEHTTGGDPKERFFATKKRIISIPSRGVTPLPIRTRRPPMPERYLSDYGQILREAPRPYRHRPLIYRWWWVLPVGLGIAAALYAFLYEKAYVAALTLVAVCVGIRWGAKRLEEM